MSWAVLHCHDNLVFVALSARHIIYPGSSWFSTSSLGARKYSHDLFSSNDVFMNRDYLTCKDHSFDGVWLVGSSAFSLTSELEGTFVVVQKSCFLLPQLDRHHYVLDVLNSTINLPISLFSTLTITVSFKREKFCIKTPWSKVTGHLVLFDFRSFSIVLRTPALPVSPSWEAKGSTAVCAKNIQLCRAIYK